MVNIKSKISTRVLSFLLAFIMLFSMLPLSTLQVYASNEQIGNAGSGGVGGWVVPDSAKKYAGSGLFKSVLNSNWGYKVSMYFAEQKENDAEENPQYDWENAKQIGYNLYLRRYPMILKLEGAYTKDTDGDKILDSGYVDFGLGNAGDEVYAQSWSKGNIYTQTTQNEFWLESLVKVSEPQYVLKSSSTGDSLLDDLLGEFENSSGTPEYETLPVTNCIGQFLDEKGNVVKNIEDAAILKDSNGNPIYRVEENSIFRYFHTEEITESDGWYHDIYYCKYPLIHSWLAFFIHLHGLTGQAPLSDGEDSLSKYDLGETFDSIDTALLYYAGAGDEIGTNVELTDMTSGEYAMHDYMCRLFNMNNPENVTPEKLVPAIRKFINVYVENIKNENNNGLAPFETMLPNFKELKNLDLGGLSFDATTFTGLILGNNVKHTGCKDDDSCKKLTMANRVREEANYLEHFGPGSAFFKALVAMYATYLGKNIPDSTLSTYDYDDLSALLSHSYVIVDTKDLALPLAKSFNNDNYRSAEYIKSYFLNPVVLNIILTQIDLNAQYSENAHTYGISTFEFLNGVHINEAGKLVKGQYKIFVEPAMFRMNGSYGLGAFTWRDLMTEFNYKQQFVANPKTDYTVNKSIIAAIYMAIPNLPNGLYLEREDNSLFVNGEALGTASGEFKQTPLIGEMTAGDGDTELWVHKLAKDEPLNTLGVAVFTSPNPSAIPPDVPWYLRTFVTIDSIDEDGNVTYSKAKNSESGKVEFKLDGKGNVTQVPKEISILGVEGGTAYLNDIVTTDKDFSFDAEKSEWVNTDLPTGIGVDLKMTAEDIAGYRFNIFIGGIKKVSNVYEIYTLLGPQGLLLDAIIKILDIFIEDTQSVEAALETWYLKYWMSKSEGFPDIAELTKELKALVYNDYEDVKLGELITIRQGGEEKTTVVKAEVIEGNEVKIEDLGKLRTPANNLILRYVVVPKPSQINILEIVTKDDSGKIVNTEYRYLGRVDLKVENGKGIIQEPVLNNPSQYISGPVMQEWVTNSVYPTYTSSSLPTMSENGKTGNDSNDKVIENYPSEPVTHNLYVKWQVVKEDGHIPGGTGTSYKGLYVPEWRLSKLWNAYSTEVGQSYAGMYLSLFSGCHSSLDGSATSYPYITTEGTWKYKVFNPNGTEGDTNLKVEKWLHSETIKSSIAPSSVTTDSPNSSTAISANINLIKNTDLSKLNLATWVGATNKNILKTKYDITETNKGTVATFTSDRYDTLNGTEKNLALKVQNTETYTNHYLFDNGVWHGGWDPVDTDGDGITDDYDWDETDWWEHICDTTSLSITPTTWYRKYNYETYKYEDVGVQYNYGNLKLKNAEFDRYTQNVTDSTKLFNKLNANDVLKVTEKINVENGFTTLRYQLNDVLNIYPEYGMLFTDNDGNNTIQWIVGDQVRKIKPIVYQTLEHKVYVTPTSNGTSVATDSRGTTAANALAQQDASAKGKQLIYKGAGVNTSYRLGRSSGSNNTALLTVKTYALDIGNTTLKSAWSNNGYNPYSTHSSLITNLKNDNKASITEKLLVDAKPFNSLDLDNAKKTGTSKGYNLVSYSSNSLQVDGGNAVCFEHKLIVRGGKLIGIKMMKSDGTVLTVSISDLKTKNKDLYDAIVGMGLYVEVGSKDNTLFKDFEHQAGRSLTESDYATKLLEARKSIDGLSNPAYIDSNVSVGKGWYSEDTTVLVVKEYVSNFEVPSVSVSDKLPMTIKNLTTPTNKAQFFSNLAKGYTYLKYNLNFASPSVSGIGDIDVYFEFSSYPFDDLDFGRQGVDYLVPNVSITDTTRLN